MPFAAMVPMPETTLYQYGGLVAFQSQVGSARQSADIEPVAETGGPYLPANVPLRRGASVSDPGH